MERNLHQWLSSKASKWQRGFQLRSVWLLSQSLPTIQTPISPTNQMQSSHMCRVNGTVDYSHELLGSMLNRYIALESTHYRLFTKIIFISTLGGLSVKCPTGIEISPLQKRWTDQHYHGIILVRHGWNDTCSARIYSIEGCMKKNVLAAKICLEC